jgi:hypothetical protein
VDAAAQPGADQEAVVADVHLAHTDLADAHLAHTDGAQATDDISDEDDFQHAADNASHDTAGTATALRDY